MILRGETLGKATLSDLCVVVPDDCQTDLTLVLPFDVGKVNKGRTFLGRAMRTSDPLLCPLGALAIYFFSRLDFHNRFDIFGEVIDFSSNDQWFFTKLLVPVFSVKDSQLERERKKREGVLDKKGNLSLDSFKKTLHKTMTKLKLPQSHELHFGRKVGQNRAEHAGLDPDEIKQLGSTLMIGNWNASTMEEKYSTKIPLKSLRLMAGFSKTKGSHYLERAKLQPPPELVDKIFKHLDIECNINRFVGTTFTTAVEFLRLLKVLRTVLVQDVVALKLLGLNHYLFHQAPFNDELFKEFEVKLKAHIIETQLLPKKTQLDDYMPELTERLHAMEQKSTGGMHGLTVKINEISGKQEEMSERQDEMLDFLKHVGSYNWKSSGNGNSLNLPREDTTNPSQYLLKVPDSVQDAFNEWYGLGVFAKDSIAGMPVDGGLEAYVKSSDYMSKKTSASDKQVSRTKKLVCYIEHHADNLAQEIDYGKRIEMSIKHFQEKVGKRSINTLVDKDLKNPEVGRKPMRARLEDTNNRQKKVRLEMTVDADEASISTVNDGDWISLNTKFHGVEVNGSIQEIEEALVELTEFGKGNPDFLEIAELYRPKFVERLNMLNESQSIQ